MTPIESSARTLLDDLANTLSASWLLLVEAVGLPVAGLLLIYERCFAAGYDWAIRASSPAVIRDVLNLTSPPYVEGRHKAFEHWDLTERLKATEDSPA